MENGKSNSRELKALRADVKMLIEAVRQLQEAQRNTLVTTEEFARLHNCTQRTVLNRIEIGIYAAKKIKGRWYLPVVS